MDRKPRVAVIGAGNWGRNHVRVFYQLGALAAVAETNEKLRKGISETYDGVKIYSSYLDVLNHPGLRGVVIATPAETHYQIALAALESGKDVLVEKPMTLSPAEASGLIDTAEKYRRVLMVGHLLFYKPAVKKILETVKSGLIGRLRFVEMRRLKLGKVRSHENVLWSFAPHDLAFLLRLVEAPVKTVQGAGMAALQQHIEDDVSINLSFYNGAHAAVHVSWLWPEDERKTVIVGSVGAIVYNENEERVWLHRKGVNSDLTVRDEGMVELPVDHEEPLEAEALHFLECIAGSQIPLSDGQKGLEVVELLVKVEKSMDRLKSDREYFVHESACVDEPVKIGRGSKVWHFSHIMAGAEIGEGCSIGQNVFIARNVKIGNNVKIQNNVSVYEGVTLEDDVFCGPSAVFTNIMTPRSAFPRNTSRDYVTTTVGRGSSIGANATIVCGVTIGRHTLVGAGAVVTKDVPDHAVVYGNPAVIKGWACRCGETIVNIGAVMLNCEKCNTQISHLTAHQPNGTPQVDG